MFRVDGGTALGLKLSYLVVPDTDFLVRDPASENDASYCDAKAGRVLTRAAPPQPVAPKASEPQPPQPEARGVCSDAAIVPKAEPPEAPKTEQRAAIIAIVRDDVRLLYTLRGADVLTAQQKQAKTAAAAGLERLRPQLEKAEKELKNKRVDVERLSEEVKAFAGATTAEATREIVSRLERLQAARGDVTKSENEVERTAKSIDVHEQNQALTDTYPVLRMGAIVLGLSRKVIYYHLAQGGTADRPVHLEHIGGYPVLQKNDALFVVIVDARVAVPPSTFVLTSTSEIQNPPDPAPLRPSANGVAGLRSKEPAAPTPDFSDAYQDVVLPLGRPLKANEVIKLTITTYFQAVTGDTLTTTSADGGKPSRQHVVVTQETSVKVLDAVELPQVHELYSFNLVTGVVGSSLRDPIFTKVKSAVGTPATPAVAATDTFPATAAVPGTPDTYTVMQDDGAGRFFPVLFFSIYWVPKDTQLRFDWRDLIPQPSIGFSLNSAANDFYLGFSIEVRRNVQVVLGWHLGRVTARGSAIPIDENITDAAPHTVKKFEPGGFLGVTFNINFIKDLFQ